MSIVKLTIPTMAFPDDGSKTAIAAQTINSSKTAGQSQKSETIHPSHQQFVD
ncbi:MAG: hypothetical protein F6K00_04475 [Leptolyngbya sp. SIOISBB]|nr:hypothetical protein [Leptolyngbya sp. SIOISBB]